MSSRWLSGWPPVATPVGDPTWTLRARKTSRAFLTGYDAVRPRPFDRRERALATAAAAWVLAYNARCQLSLRVDHPGLAATIPGLGSKVALLRERGDEYLQLSW